MAIPTIEQQLKSKFPIPYTLEDLNRLRTDSHFKLIHETYVKRSEMTNLAYSELVKASNTYNQFLDVLHKYDCDFNNNRFSFEYQGTSSFYPRSQPADRSCIREVKDYLSPIYDTKVGHIDLVKDELLKINAMLISEYNVLLSQFRILEKGAAGEKYVRTQLDLIKDKYIFLENVKFKYSDLVGKSTETDVYIMTPKALLCCEIKNWGNEKDVYHIYKDGQWIKNPDGRYPEIITPSPFSQNTRHALATDALLRENNIDCKIIPVIIIGNEVVRIENESNNAIIRASEIYNFVENLALDDQYNEDFQKTVINVLERNNDLEENHFPLSIWNEKDSQTMLAYTNNLLQQSFALHNFAEDLKKSFKAQWPLHKTILMTLCRLIIPVSILTILIYYIRYFMINPDKIPFLILGFGVIVFLMICDFIAN